MAASPRFRDLSRWQRFGLGGIWVGLILLLLTPLVVSGDAAYGGVVGKALYARTLVEWVFGLWVLLALANVAFRPPRSSLLFLLTLSIAAALLAAVSGINAERSLWSTYERMQGVVNSTHWLALATVVASVLRRPRDWRLLFALNLATSTVVAGLAIGRAYDLPLPYFAEPLEGSWQAAGSFGNSTQLANYALVNTFLAVGMATWAFVKGRSLDAERKGRHIAGAAIFVVVAFLNVWVLALSASLGAVVAFAGAVGALGLTWSVIGRGPTRRLAAAGTAVVASCGMVMAVLFFTDNPWTTNSDNPVLRRLSYASIKATTTQTRLAAWQAGLNGFAERPILGWGPDNFLTPFGKHADGIVATFRAAHDHPHNELIEEAVTKGVLGAATYVSLWVLTFVVVIRALLRRRSTDPPRQGEAALVLFVGAALLAELAFKQSLFASTVASLQHLMLLGFVISLEHLPRNEGRRCHRPEPLHAVAAWVGRKWVRATVGTASLGLCFASAYSSTAIYAGAAALARFAAPNAPLSTLDETINAFPPMANYGRRLFLDDLANRWRDLRVRHGREAARLLARADMEAPAAEAAEPHNWVVIHSIARLYGVVATTDPEYAERAEHYRKRAIELSPRIAIAPPRGG